MAPRPGSSCTKKVNTYYPNKYIGVTLMKIGNKIYISIMFEILFKIIWKHGVNCQFGSTPGVGCQYGTFTIKNNTAPKTQPKYPNMGCIHRPSQGLWHLQPWIHNGHFGKIWRSTKAMINNQTHVWQHCSPAHHTKDWTSHRLQSGHKKRLQHVPSPISVPEDGLQRNTEWGDCHETKQSQNFTQKKLTKINRTTYEPPTR